MESYAQLIDVYNPLLLDGANYKYWKVRTKTNICDIDEDAWTAVECGWEKPYVTSEDGELVAKPRTKWTATEKKMSKFNSKALNAIFKSVKRREFELIQGCESAKEAWDILQNVFEGTDNVKRTRLELLASKFENIRMNDDEKIVDFSARLSSIANEAQVLVGMLQAEEIEMDSNSPKLLKDHVFTVDEDKQQILKVEEVMRLMIQKFEENMDLLFKTVTTRLKEREEGQNKYDVECYKCHGIGNIKSDCPSFKKKEIKCNKCDGYGHTKGECISSQKKMMKMGQRGSDRKSCEEKDVLNLVALHGCMKSEKENKEHESAGSCVTQTISVAIDSDSESDQDVDVQAEFRSLFDSWVKLSNDNIQLIKTNRMLEAKVSMLELKADPEKTVCELSVADRHVLEQKINKLQEEFQCEKEKSKSLEHELSENHKKIRMLNNGSANLDQILAMGRTEKHHYGLGYCGISTCVSENTEKLSNFVLGSRSLCTAQGHEPAHGASKLMGVSMSCNTLHGDLKKNDHSHKAKSITSRQSQSCFHCGSCGHVVAFCVKRQESIKRAWQLNKCFIEPRRYNAVWIAKQDLYVKSIQGEYSVQYPVTQDKVVPDIPVQLEKNAESQSNENTCVIVDAKSI
ncbi:unnamed protein product [Arabidopsis halleri]